MVIIERVTIMAVLGIRNIPKNKQSVTVQGAVEVTQKFGKIITRVLEMYY